MAERRAGRQAPPDDALRNTGLGSTILDYSIFCTRDNSCFLEIVFRVLFYSITNFVLQGGSIKYFDSSPERIVIVYIPGIVYSLVLRLNFHR